MSQVCWTPSNFFIFLSSDWPGTCCVAVPASWVMRLQAHVTTPCFLFVFFSKFVITFKYFIEKGSHAPHISLKLSMYPTLALNFMILSPLSSSLGLQMWVFMPYHCCCRSSSSSPNSHSHCLTLYLRLAWNLLCRPGLASDLCWLPCFCLSDAAWITVEH